MSLKRAALYLFGGFFALAGVGLVTDWVTYDRDATLRDYSELKRTLAQHHANLDWLKDHRGIDLRAHDSATLQRLQSSSTRIGAYRAIRAFIDGLSDPHLFVDWGDAPTSAQDGRVSSRVEPLGRDFCKRAGYAAEDFRSDLAYSDLAAWRPIDSPFFPAGLLGDVGILRIAEFRETRYQDACAQAKPDNRKDRAIQLATRRILQADLVKTLQALEDAGASHIAIDLTGNGGGM